MRVQQKLPQLEQRATSLYDTSDGVHLGAPELREDGAFPKIRGYAAVFNQLSQPLWMGVRERIKPGAFKATLNNGADVRALVNHEPSLLLGRNKAGTLRLEEDQHGLRYEIDPPNTSVGRDILVSLGRRDITQSSFGFRSKDEEYKKENGEFVRELIAVDLFDISVVTYPAYTQTSVSVRSLFPNMEENEARSVFEPFFRDIKRTLDPPPQLLPDFQKRLRVHRLALAGDVVREQQEAERAARKIQAVIFTKPNWNLERAKQWLADHEYKNENFDETTYQFRFTQFDAADWRGEFETLDDNMPRGVSMVAGKA